MYAIIAHLMEDFKLKAKMSFGGDYDCHCAWPEDTYLQCGDHGLVLSEETYYTAFFEAFPKNPSTFIRGEGKTLQDAELAAFNKYLKIKACDVHEYERHGDTEHANCLKCGLFTTHCLAPTHSCSVCGKSNVNYYTHDEALKLTYFCRNHFIEEVRKLVDNYDIDNIPEYAGMSDPYELNKQYVSEMYFAELSLKYGLVSVNEDEYKVSNLLDDKRKEFDHYCRMRIHKLHFALNDLRPENEKFVISGLAFPKIYRHLFLVPALYEALFKEFYKVEEDVNIEAALIEFHGKMYERYRKK